MTAAVREINKCDRPPCSLSHRRRRISESCLSQPAWTTTTKRREQYAAVNLKRNLRSAYCTIEADRHEASSGLSAAAELFVNIEESKQEDKNGHTEMYTAVCTHWSGVLLQSILHANRSNTLELM